MTKFPHSDSEVLRGELSLAWHADKQGTVRSWHRLPHPLPPLTHAIEPSEAAVLNRVSIQAAGISKSSRMLVGRCRGKFTSPLHGFSSLLCLVCAQTWIDKAGIRLPTFSERRAANTASRVVLYRFD